MKPLFGKATLLLSLLGVVAFEGPALAEAPTSAEALFKRGVERMNAGDYASGCMDIVESQRVEPLPGTLFSLATCMDRWGLVATAAALYGDYLTVYEALPDERKARQGERPKVAARQRDKLKVEAPELTLVLPPDAPDTTLVKRDGEVVAAAALGTALAVDPGKYTITTQVPNGPVWEQRITLGKGDKKRVVLEVKPPQVIETKPPQKAKEIPAKAVSPPRRAKPPAPQGASEQREAAYAMGGVGLAGLAMSGIMGGMALFERGSINDHCGAAIKAPETQCDLAGLIAVQRAKMFGLASTIAAVVGIAGLGTGIALLVTDKPPTRQLVGSRRKRSWITLDVSSLGPGRAMIGARGAW